jgi:DNA-binding NarL/FixJ family response regulator
MPSPIVRETIKKLKARRAELQKQVKGPLEEIAQIEADLIALGVTSSSRPASRSGRRPAAPRPAPGATQAAILRAIRNGATEPDEIAAKTGLPARTVSGGVTNYLNKQNLLVRGPNGLTLTKAGRDKLRELEG